ncbi:MAG: hypothetical protein ACI4PF_01025, partial [Christensenellales bacterium]
MDQVTVSQIFNAIKSDDLVLFSSLIKGNENISFGRFPILSLCYLYNSQKIIGEYKLKLCKIKEFTYVNEFFEIYNSFKKVAGRALRLYTNNGIISPLEMLAILHKDSLVIKNFKLFNKNENILDNLRQIYLFNSQKVIITPTSIKISKSPLSNYFRSRCKKALCLSCCFMLLLVFTYLITGFTIGLGTAILPFKISSQEQFYLALQSGGNYKLNTDIYLDDADKCENFDGNLDGNYHTIYIKSLPNESLIKNNLGIIKNLNIIYSNLSGEVSSSISLFVNNNEGIIDNVNIKCDNINLNVNKSQSSDIYITVFALINKGQINNCQLNLIGEMSASSIGECFVSGFVGENYGKIENCTFASGNIKTSDIDLSGIVILNNIGAKVINCKNYSTLLQDSILDEWSPNVSGITLTNYGLIENSYNLGDLSINSLNDKEDAQGNVFLAGISTLNYGSVIKCLNKGNLTATSKRLIIY